MAIINGTTGIDKVQDLSITPDDLVQKMTLMTAQTASGTSVDFTGIPSWAKRVTVMFDGVSTNGVSNTIVQLGDSSGIASTGYLSTSTSLGGTPVSIQNTTGFINYTASASAISHGNINIVKLTANSFVCSGTLIRSESAITTLIGGSKTLTTDLTTVRITTVNGTDTFDAGSINIMYEG